MTRGKRASFVVRTVQDPRGRVSGIIERVATGAKETFTSMEAIGQVIARMLGGERHGRRHGALRSRRLGEEAKRNP